MKRKFDNQLLMVCPANIKDYANAAAKQTMGSGNEHTFAAAYSANGENPPTHYASHSNMTSSFVVTLKGLSDAFPTMQVWVSGPADFSLIADLPQVKIVDELDPREILQELGLLPITV